MFNSNNVAATALAVNIANSKPSSQQQQSQQTYHQQQQQQPSQTYSSINM